jgi:CMP-2-keto-3-deoxyoctulosonic acid synthetase
MGHEEIALTLESEGAILQRESDNGDDRVCRASYKRHCSHERQRIVCRQATQPLIKGGDVDQLAQLVGWGWSVLGSDALPTPAIQRGSREEYEAKQLTHDFPF